MALFYYLCISLPAILLAVVYYHVRSRGAAFVFTVAIRLLFSRYLKSFSVKRISIFPIAVDGLQVTTKGSRHRPEISLNWKSLKLHIDYKRIWRNYYFNWNIFEAAAAAAAAVIKEESSKKFICVTIEEFTVSSPNLRFKDVLNPSSSASSFPTLPIEEVEQRNTPESWGGSIKRRFFAIPLLFSRLLTTACLQKLFDLFLVQLDNFNVDIDLPTHESSIKVSALQCLFYAGGNRDFKEGETVNSDPSARSTSVDGFGLLLAMDMTEGKLAIRQSGELAFDYSGRYYRFSIDVHVPSRHMTVGFRSLSNNKNRGAGDSNPSADSTKSIAINRDTVDVRVQAFLDFYTRFQSAEDDAIELKQAKGLGSSGRMRTISLGIDSLKVGVTDFRTPHKKTVLADDFFLGIRNFKVDGVTGARMGGTDWQGGIGIFADLFDLQELSSVHESKKISVHIDKELMISAGRVEWLPGRVSPPPSGPPSGPPSASAPAPAAPRPPGARAFPRFSTDKQDLSRSGTSSSSGVWGEVAVFELLSATKSVRVVNGGDYIDLESLKGSVKRVQLERLTSETLNWQLIAQAVSESMPTSRFSHVKHSELEVRVDSVLFSISPEESEGPHSPKPSPPSQQHEHHSKEIDKIVSFHFTGLTGRKESRADQIVSKYSVHSELLEVEASLLANSLQLEYNINVDSVDDSVGGEPDKAGSGIFLDTFNMRGLGSRSGSGLGGGRSLDRVGAFYSFCPFELTAQLMGPGKLQIESVKAESFYIDFMSSSQSSSARPGGSTPSGRGGESVSRSEFLRSSLESAWSPVQGQTAGSDIVCDLGHTSVHLSAAGMLKLSLTNHMVKNTIDRITATMARIKGMKARRHSKDSKSKFSSADLGGLRTRLDKDRDKEEDPPPSNALLTVKCSQLNAGLLITAERFAPSVLPFPSDTSPPMPSSPSPHAFTRPSPASDSPQRGSSASSDSARKPDRRSSSSSFEELSIAMDFSSFEYQSSVLENKYSWDSGTAIVNDFTDKTFLSSTGFVYHTRRPAAGVSHSYGSRVDSSKIFSTPFQSADSEVPSPFGLHHEREGDGIGPEVPGVRYTTVRMTEVEVGMSPHMRLGVAVDSMLAQYDAYKVAKEARVRTRAVPSPPPPAAQDSLDDFPGGLERECTPERERSFTYNASTDTFEFEDLDLNLEEEAPVDTFDYEGVGKRNEQQRVLEEQGKRVPSVLAMSMGIYRFTLDAVHDDVYVPGFAVLECSNLKIKIDSTKDESAVYDEIATLDFGPEDPPDIPAPSTPGSIKLGSGTKSSKKSRGTSEKKRDRKEKKAANAIKRTFLQYKHSGGVVTVSQDRMVMRFASQKEAYMDTTKWRMTGPLYLASAVVFDGAIRTEEEEVCLADTAYLPALLVGGHRNPPKGTYPRMAPLHSEDFLDTPYSYTPASSSTHKDRGESPNSRSGYYGFDISSTDGSYGSALRPFDSPKGMGRVKSTHRAPKRTVCVASVLRSAAPVKIYWDAQASASSLDMWLDDSTKDCTDSFHASLAPCLAPVREAAPPLPPWDSMLYWFHGFLTCSVNEMVVTNLLLESTPKTVLLQSKLEEVTWHISETTFEFSARALEVGLITQKGLKKAGGARKPHFESSNLSRTYSSGNQSRPSLRRTFSRSEGRLYETARLLYVPGIVMAVSHSVFDTATAYSHHDVYLYPARSGGGGLGRCVDDDKYSYLRSRKMSSKCNFELRILDSLSEPLTVNARLDLLHGLFEAVYLAAQQKKNPDCFSPTDSTSSGPSSPHPPSSAQLPSVTPVRLGQQTPRRMTGPTPLTAPPSGLQSKVKRMHLYPPLLVREKSTLTVFSIMRQWDVQVSLGRIVVCSWPAKNALSGVVLTLAGLDLQLRLLREVPMDYRSKAPFFLVPTSPHLSPPSEVSVSPASLTPFSLLFPTMSEEIDRTHRPSLSPINEGTESESNKTKERKGRKKDRGNSVTFSDTTKGGGEESEEDPEFPYPRKLPNDQKKKSSAPSKQQSDKDRAKARYPVQGRHMPPSDEDQETDENDDDEEDEDFPMQVEHLFTEIHFAEIYARDWTVSRHCRMDSEGGSLDNSGNERSAPSSPMGPGSSRGSEKEGRGCEPSTVTDLQRLFTPLCKLAHASRVVVSLTEDGEVAGKLDTFETVGLLPVSQQRSQPDEVHMSQEMAAAAINAERVSGNSPRLHSFIGKERRKSSMDTTDATRIKCMQTRFSASPLQRTVSRSFTEGSEGEERRSSYSLLNPSTLSPNKSFQSAGGYPMGPLGETGVGAQSPLGTRSTSNHLIDRLHRASSSSSAGSRTKGYNTNTGTGTSTSTRPGHTNRVPEGASSFGNKIWGLRVVDMRLLMTIAIRDSVFGYVGRCFQFFQYDVVEGFKPKILKAERKDEGVKLSAPPVPPDSCMTRSPHDSNSQSSSSGEETARQDGDEDDLIGLGDFRAQRSFPASSGSLTPPRSISPRPISLQLKDGSERMKEEGKPPLRPRSCRDGDAKATVTDFLPAVKVEALEKSKTFLLPNEEKRERRDRERSKSEVPAVTNPMLQSRGGKERDEGESLSLSLSGLGDGADKKKKVKLADIASKGFESTQLLDLGASPAFGKMQRREEALASQRERESEKAKKKNLGVLAGSELAELLSRPARPSSSTLRERDRVGRRRGGVQASGDIKSALHSDITRALTDENGAGSPKSSSKDATSHSKASSTSANTAANRQHVGAGEDPSGGLSTSRRYFMLELVDPQLNFLDTKSHSSLIMVAGRSSLEGQRETTAVLIPAAGTGQGPQKPPKGKRTGREKEALAMEPKRQNKIKLHMDKVSAFTVPTLAASSPSHSPSNDNKGGEDDSDVVHWKAMDCTVEKVGDRMRFERLHGRNVDTGGLGRRGRDDRDLPPDGKEGIGELGRGRTGSSNRERGRASSKRSNRVCTELLRESPNLRVAVKDFEVQASYTFWMDVTVKEANKMYVHRDRVSKDLVCSFKLDLPELCLDITSSQFYIGINVIKNVLLAPPPEMAGSIRDGLTGDEDGDREESAESKVTEIFRDSQLLSADAKADLNLKNRQSREEVKALIEEYFNRAVEVKYGMARVVDLFIGKGTWILRSPPASQSNSHSQEKIPTLSPSYLSGMGKSRTSSQASFSSSDRDKDKEKERDLVELLETGFTGVHATFTYHEDRSSSALFEVQRFWARNMNPAACDAEAATRAECREKGLRARASKMISRSLQSLKKRDSGVSTASDPSSDETRSPTVPPDYSSESSSPKASDKGVSQLSYKDTMTALELRERERLLDKSWVLIPVLVDTEPCRRCGQLFDAEDNDSNACVFHADRDGKPGEYRRMVVKNRVAGADAPMTLVKMWTCCRRTEEHSPGCFSRPHICKDVMVSVRALGAPSVRIENIEMSVLRALEISIFPGTMTSWLQVRITRQLADVLHNYFSIDAVSNSEILDPAAAAVAGAAKERTDGGGPSTPSPDIGALTPALDKKPSARTRVMSYLSYGKSASDKAEGSVTDKAVKPKTKDKDKDREKDTAKERDLRSDKGRDRALTMANGNTGGIIYGGAVGPGGRQEGLYIRYLRVGDIQVDVSLSGFPLNVENYRAVVEPFFCRGEVLPNWQRLIYSFERHASRSLIRNTASSSLTRLSNFFSFSGAPRSDGVATTGDKIVDVIKRTTGTRGGLLEGRSNPEDEEKKKRALLLGGASI